MTRFVLSLAAVFAFAPLASAQDAGSTRADVLSELEAECNALLATGDSRALDCTQALQDARRASSPVVVARIRRQYADDAFEATEVAVHEVDAREEYDLFSEDEADTAWAGYGD